MGREEGRREGSSEKFTTAVRARVRVCAHAWKTHVLGVMHARTFPVGNQTWRRGALTFRSQIARLPTRENKSCPTIFTSSPIISRISFDGDFAIRGKEKYDRHALQFLQEELYIRRGEETREDVSNIVAISPHLP